MQERNPEALLKPFMSTLAGKGLAFQQALFVPPESSYRKLGGQEQHKDLSWQQGLQRVYQTHLTTSPNGVCFLSNYDNESWHYVMVMRHGIASHHGMNMGFSS